MSDVKMEMYFSFIKNCLLTFDYPLAHSMSDVELGDIFTISNRCFLISWMLKLLDSTYEETLENLENDKDTLGNLVYELGFCTQKEKLPFMTGNLLVSQQVKILYNVFNFINDVKKYNAEEQIDAVTNNEILALNNTDLNLFPMYGNIKLGNTEQCLQWSEFEKEINDIKAIVLNEKENDPDDLTECKFSDDIQQFLEKLKAELPNIKFVIENICKKKAKESGEGIKLQSNSGEILKKCRDNLQIISQFVKDINVITEFLKNDTELNEEGGKNEAYFEMVNTLYQEVLSAIKYIKCL